MNQKGSEAYRILFGPLYHAPVLGQHLADPNIKTFSTTQEVRITERHNQRPFQADFSYHLANPIQHLFEALNGWKPDFLIWYNLALMGVPSGVETSPCITIAVIHDWHLNLQACLDYATAFDYVLSDRAFVNILHNQGFKHAAWWPCYAHDPSTHYLIPGLERDYDITFLGNLDYRYHRERNEWLSRVLAFEKQYRVLFSDRYYGFDYTRMLNRSKIVFNHSIRGEMNMRAYEALACGALLFMESDNLEIRDFLEDGVSCVLYNRDNLEDKLKYYLSHDKERQEIAANGVQAIQAFRHEHQWQLLTRQLPGIQQVVRKHKRLFAQTPTTWQTLVRARQIYFSRSPQSAAITNKHLNQILEFSQHHHPTEILYLHAAQAAFEINALWTPTSLFRHQPLPTYIPKVIHQLARVSQAFPDDVLHQFNYASALTFNRQYPQALQIWNRLIEHLPSLQLSLNQLSWRVLLPTGQGQHITDFGHLWNQELGKILQHKAPTSHLNQLLLWQAWEQVGYSLLYLNQFNEAITAFFNAEKTWPGNYFTYAPLLSLLVQTQRHTELLPLLRKAVKYLGLAEVLQRDYLLTLYHQQANSMEYQHSAETYALLMRCTEGGGSSAQNSLHGWLPKIMLCLPEILNATLEYKKPRQ